MREKYRLYKRIPVIPENSEDAGITPENIIDDGWTYDKWLAELPIQERVELEQLGLYYWRINNGA